MVQCFVYNDEKVRYILSAVTLVFRINCDTMELCLDYY